MGKLLLYLLFFFLPTQLGKHFWFDFSYKLGQRVDYLSPTVYLTDLILILTLIAFLIKKVEAQRSKVKGQNHNLKLKAFFFSLDSPVLCYISILLISYWLFVIRQNPFLLAYNLARLIEFIILSVIIAKTFKKEDFPKIISVLNIALFLQVGLAIYQVVMGKSLGLWLLGERTFSISTPGIARFVAPTGYQLLRAYGTFPHPNVLGGFCLFLLVANTFLFFSVQGPTLYRYLLGFIFSLLGIWLSFSAVAVVLSQIFLLSLVVIFFFRSPGQVKLRGTSLANSSSLAPSHHPRSSARGGPPLRRDFALLSQSGSLTRLGGFWLWFLASFSFLIILITNYYLLITFKDDSFSRRLTLLGVSWEMVKRSPLFGIGLGNFIPSMPPKLIGKTYFWQPVHNIVALVGVETGLLGLTLVVVLMKDLFVKFKVQSSKFKAKIQNSKLFFSYILMYWWLVILITGLFDHYWLTLQQGRLMLTLLLGLSFVRDVVKDGKKPG